MAAPTLKEGYKVALYYDSNGSGSFTFIGAINSTNVERTASIAEAWVRDNSSAFAAPTRIRRKTAQDLKISGSGYYDKTFYDALNTLYAAGTVRTWRADISGGNRISGSMLISSLNMSGDAVGDGFAEMTIELTLSDSTETVGDQS